MIDVEISPQDWLDTVTGFYEALYHDLKTPMAILFNHVQHMEKMQGLPESATMCLAEIKRSSFRMAKLVRDANDRLRLNRGLLTPKYVKTDVVAVMRDICENAQALMRTKDIRIIFESQEESYYMSMDKQLWERIVLNLLANGKDYSYHGGDICVSLKVENDNFILSIRDFGVGIPEDKGCNLFAKYAGDTDRGLRSGLGLYIVKELLALMGGSVELLRANPGTNVVIQAPIIHKEDIQERTMTVDDFFSDNMVQMELSNI